MAFALNGTLGVDLTRVDTTKEFALGTKVAASDGACFQYVSSSVAATQYSACKVDDDWSLALLTTTVSGSEPTKVGIPQIALDGSVSTVYGWVFVGPGPCIVQSAADCAADVALYTTATAGRVDDDGTGTDRIHGLKLTAAASGTTGTAAWATEQTYTN